MSPVAKNTEMEIEKSPKTSKRRVKTRSQFPKVQSHVNLRDEHKKLLKNFHEYICRAVMPELDANRYYLR